MCSNRSDEQSESVCRSMAGHIAHMNNPPTISMVVVLQNPNPQWLREGLNCILGQIYPHLQLCIAISGASSHVKDVLEEYRRLDARVRIDYHPQEEVDYSTLFNSALSLATGDFFTLISYKDIIPIDALYYVVARLQYEPEALVIYSDEDKFCEDGSRVDAHYKSDWNPDLFFSHNYIGRLCVIRRSILKCTGTIFPAQESSVGYEILLKCLPYLRDEQIIHIPQLLYHERIAPQASSEASNCARRTTDSCLKALQEYFAENGFQKNRVEKGASLNTYRVRWPIPANAPLVSLLIPTRDRRELIETAVSSILHKSDYKNFELIILDNDSSDSETLDYFDKIQRHDPRVRVLSCTGPFDYSAINNYGVSQANGEILGFINNDIEVISCDWLDEMVSHALRPDIGCVGAKLYYSNNTLQHCGVIVGLGGVAGHSHKHLPKDKSGYFSRANIVQNLSGVTAACMLVRKSVFEEVGGFDDKYLKIAFNDVDFCLKVRNAGYRNLWSPYAELYHHESLSRGYEDTVEKKQRFDSEKAVMRHRWGGKLLQDPYYNLNLTIYSEDFAVAPLPRVYPRNFVGRKITLCALCRDAASSKNLFKDIVDYFPANTEYLLFDNSILNIDCYEAIRRFLAESNGDYVLIIHDDVRFNESTIDKLYHQVESVLAQYPQAGIYGVAGMGNRFFTPLGHFYNAKGEVKHGFNQFGPVSSLDECFLLIRNGIGINLDKKLQGFHFYGTELCLQARNLGFTSHVIDFPIFHPSEGSIDESFLVAKQNYEKHLRENRCNVFLATTCSTIYSGKNPFMIALSDAISLLKTSNKYITHKDHKKVQAWIQRNRTVEYGRISWYAANIVANIIFFKETSRILKREYLLNIKKNIKSKSDSFYWYHLHPLIRPFSRIYTDIQWWSKNWKTRL